MEESNALDNENTNSSDWRRMKRKPDNMVCQRDSITRYLIPDLMATMEHWSGNDEYNRMAKLLNASPKQWMEGNRYGGYDI